MGRYILLLYYILYNKIYKYIKFLFIIYIINILLYIRLALLFFFQKIKQLIIVINNYIKSKKNIFI